jgi:uncharacterized coiled-coil DUF342 family protein
MPQETQEANSPSQNPFIDVNTRVRNIEEKNNLLKDRIVLIGNSLVSLREKSFSDIQELKSQVQNISSEISSLKQIVQNLAEISQKYAKQSDIDILKRQFDLFRNTE